MGTFVATDAEAYEAYEAYVGRGSRGSRAFRRMSAYLTLGVGQVT
jgi:hypothetical protein